MLIKPDIKSFAKFQWLGHWSGWWALTNNSLLGYQYTKLLNKSLGVGLKRAFFISRKGFTTCYLTKPDYKRFGLRLTEGVKKNKKVILVWCKELRERTEEILALMEKLKRKSIGPSEFNEFKDAFYNYGVPHRAIKIVVDFLPPQLLKKFLPSLQKARVYAEPVYAETEKFLRVVARKVSDKTGYRDKILLYLTRAEFDKYFKSGKLPSRKVLEKRFLGCAILCVDGNYKIFTGNTVDRIEKIITNSVQTENVIIGSTAYPGKVRGKVKIVFDPRKESGFTKGDILVTGMTRPEFLPLIKKSAAFITDAGGMLSHAAITARELRKPCLVGTLNATKLLRNGDLVVVDAAKGMVRKI